MSTSLQDVLLQPLADVCRRRRQMQRRAAAASAPTWSARSTAAADSARPRHRPTPRPAFSRRSRSATDSPGSGSAGHQRRFDAAGRQVLIPRWRWPKSPASTCRPTCRADRRSRPPAAWDAVAAGRPRTGLPDRRGGRPDDRPGRRPRPRPRAVRQAHRRPSRRFATAWPTPSSPREGAAAALELAWDADDEVLRGVCWPNRWPDAQPESPPPIASRCWPDIGFTAEHPFHRFLARAPGPGFGARFGRRAACRDRRPSDLGRVPSRGWSSCEQRRPRPTAADGPDVRRRPRRAGRAS